MTTTATSTTSTAATGAGGTGRGRTMVIWCPDWPATAAALDGGHGRDVPLAVLHANRVLACNAAARGEGVRRGMRRRDAQGRCPTLVLAPANPDLEAQLFEPVLAVVEELRPGVAPLRPGVVALPSPSRYYGGEERAAAIFLERLVDHGLWDVRAGIADEVFTAEQAARQAGIQEHLVVPPGGSAVFLGGLPVEVLTAGSGPGDGGAAGAELVSLLQRLGLRRLEEFAALPAAGVAARFGPYGARLHRLLHGGPGVDVTPRTPPPERECEEVFEPGLASIETVCFSMRRTAERFVAGLADDQAVCTVVQLEVETDRGTTFARHWAHATWFGPTDLVDRIHWQLQGGVRTGLLDGPVVRVRLVPVTVEPAADHAEALWGSGSDERVERGIAKVQAMLGYEAVVRPVPQGGRAPADRQAWVPWGDRAVGLRPTDRPWPGAIPGPAPTRVYPVPWPAEVVDAVGHPVRLTERGVLTGTPDRFRPGVGEAGWLPVQAWAGPWPVDENWWEAGPGLVARCQVVDAAGRAWLLRYGDDVGWCTEASYD